MNETPASAPRLGRVGLWTRQLDSQPTTLAEEAVLELEQLGYPTLWIPEAVDRDVVTHAALLLAATRSIVVATGIARIQARAALTTALAERQLSERFPGRFLLGLGVSHPFVVERRMGLAHEKPIAAMTRYLDALDRFGARRRVLAALGPRMLALAATRSLGVHTYLAPVEHTAWARDQLGDGLMLAPTVKAMLTTDVRSALDLVRPGIEQTARAPAYRDNLRRVGFETDGAADDRLVHAIVALGDVGDIVQRVGEHLDAGADHVCVEVITGDDTTLPLPAWRTLAPAFAALG